LIVHTAFDKESFVSMSAAITSGSFEPV
jgi:hypothetical protein